MKAYQDIPVWRRFLSVLSVWTGLPFAFLFSITKFGWFASQTLFWLQLSIWFLDRQFLEEYLEKEEKSDD